MSSISSTKLSSRRSFWLFSSWPTRHATATAALIRRAGSWGSERSCSDEAWSSFHATPSPCELLLAVHVLASPLPAS